MVLSTGQHLLTLLSLVVEGVGCDQPLKEPQQTGMFKCECNSTINSKSGLVTQETEYHKLMACQDLEVETVKLFKSM